MCPFSGRDNLVVRSRLQNIKIHDINIELSIYARGGSRLVGRGVSVSRSHMRYVVLLTNLGWGGVGWDGMT